MTEEMKRLFKTREGRTVLSDSVVRALFFGPVRAGARQRGMHGWGQAVERRGGQQRRHWRTQALAHAGTRA